MTRSFASLLAALTLLACQPAPSDSNGESGPSAAATVGSRRVGNIYPTATSVRLFVETFEDWENKSQGLKADVAPASGRLLTPRERATFESFLRIHRPPETWSSACFIPHHFFRYYDRAGREVGEIAVCFCCYNISASPNDDEYLARGEAWQIDYPRLEAFVGSLGVPTDVDCTEPE